MQQRERVFAYVVVGFMLLGLFWLLFNFDWTQQGSQFRQIGEEAFDRRSAAVTSYDYVANSRTQQYWPNREPYVSRIPKADRVFIRDRDALQKFHGYTPGPR
jgi:hypothetical protein